MESACTNAGAAVHSRYGLYHSSPPRAELLAGGEDPCLVASEPLRGGIAPPLQERDSSLEGKGFACHVQSR